MRMAVTQERDPPGYQTVLGRDALPRVRVAPLPQWGQRVPRGGVGDA